MDQPPFTKTSPMIARNESSQQVIHSQVDLQMHVHQANPVDLHACTPAASPEISLPLSGQSWHKGSVFPRQSVLWLGCHYRAGAGGAPLLPWQMGSTWQTESIIPRQSVFWVGCPSRVGAEGTPLLPWRPLRRADATPCPWRRPRPGLLERA